MLNCRGQAVALSAAGTAARNEAVAERRHIRLGNISKCDHFILIIYDRHYLRRRSDTLRNSLFRCTVA